MGERVAILSEQVAKLWANLEANITPDIHHRVVGHLGNHWLGRRLRQIEEAVFAEILDRAQRAGEDLLGYIIGDWHHMLWTNAECEFRTRRQIFCGNGNKQRLAALKQNPECLVLNCF